MTATMQWDTCSLESLRILGPVSWSQGLSDYVSAKAITTKATLNHRADTKRRELDQILRNPAWIKDTHLHGAAIATRAGWLRGYLEDDHEA